MRNKNKIAKAAEPEKPVIDEAERKALIESLVKKQAEEPAKPAAAAPGKSVSLPQAFTSVAQGIGAILEQVRVRKQFADDCESKPALKAYEYVEGQLAQLLSAATPVVDAIQKGAGK